eukprot:TRINITY_DN84720_c0_g1_i1.p1 TRINITY_DN84720_c0_g1~~TRINITY_DN84720_c0_g1_i1.p1  ORF type:complete len:196 (-),score=41.34 TRINITY_DN84720_c0_g1_i1:616-1203(-)
MALSDTYACPDAEAEADTSSGFVTAAPNRFRRNRNKPAPTESSTAESVEALSVAEARQQDPADAKAPMPAAVPLVANAATTKDVRPTASVSQSTSIAPGATRNAASPECQPAGAGEPKKDEPPPWLPMLRSNPGSIVAAGYGEDRLDTNTGVSSGKSLYDIQTERLKAALGPPPATHSNVPMAGGKGAGPRMGGG